MARLNKNRLSTGKIRRKSKIKKLTRQAFIGYFLGVLITYACFMIFTLQMHLKTSTATNICLIMALILTLGIAFNRNIRCMVILTLPQFFSVKGRSAVITYAFVLMVIGPAKNILSNIEVLSKSLSCSQEQLKTALEGMLDVIKTPMIAIKTAIRQAVASVKKTMEKVEKVLYRLKELLESILKVIKGAFSWLGGIVSVCNKEIGTPFQRCQKIFNNAIQDCRKKLGVLKVVCNVASLAKAVCYSVKFIDLVCILVDFVSDAIVGVVQKRLEKFTESIKQMFYVSITFEHSFRFETNASKKMTQIGADILADIRAKSKEFFLLFGWMEILSALMFFRIILKAFLYKSKYLNSERFDNYFINQDIKEIDKQCEKYGKETVLPLTRKERKKYVMISSLLLVRAERMKLARSAMFLLISTIQLLSVCALDYILFSLLMTIRNQGRNQAGLEVPSYLSVNVIGSGFIAEIYQGIVDAFQPMAEKYEIDPVICLPNPKPPNFMKYFQIGTLAFLAWLFLILEPYGLRLRQVTMAHFYPNRAKERAAWLHNNIIISRSTFLKFARRQARAKFSKDDTINQVSLLDWIRAKTNRFWIMRKIMGDGNKLYCLLCGSSKKQNEIVFCSRPGCNGKYCSECFIELNKICFICNDPIQYGDLSDYSEEKCSSDELSEVIASSSKTKN